MNDAEKKLIHDFVRFLVDSELPSLIDAEEQRIPAAYQPLVKVALGAMEPQLIAAIDKFVDAKLAAPAQA